MKGSDLQIGDSLKHVKSGKVSTVSGRDDAMERIQFQGGLLDGSKLYFETASTFILSRQYEVIRAQTPKEGM